MAVAAHFEIMYSKVDKYMILGARHDTDGFFGILAAVVYRVYDIIHRVLGKIAFL